MTEYFETEEVPVGPAPSAELVKIMEEIGNLSTPAQELAPGSVYAVRDRDGQVQVYDTLAKLADMEEHDDLRTRKARKSGRVTVHAPDSFIDYVARHGRPGTEVWMDLPTRKVFAVLDGDTPDARGLRQHVVQMELLYTDQWKGWKGLDRKYVRQAVLGEFIIDHYSDFIKPAASAMLNHATTFQAIKNVDFQSVENVKNGEKSIAYIETIGQKQIPGSAELPEEVTFKTQIFEHGDEITMMARWFYTIEEKNLLMKLLIDRVRETEQAAFELLCERLREGLGELMAPPAVFYGCDR